jgi:hypothetical protein
MMYFCKHWALLASTALVVGCQAAHTPSQNLDAAPDAVGGVDASAQFDAVPGGDGGTAPARLYGVTVDDISGLANITESLVALPHKPTTRIVFDESQSPAYYAQAVPAIHAVSHVMGEVLDSEFMPNFTVAQYTARTTAYLDAFATSVDIWEIANEVNGEWLGATADVVAKMTGAYDVVKARGYVTELTLYGCSDAAASNDMFTWINANVPPRMRTGLDYVLVSYYEGDCGNPRNDWADVFTRLHQLFPNSKIGFGEVGAVTSNGNAITAPAVAGPYLEKYYGMQIATPGYIGGYFWWYFAQDMCPKTKPMFAILANAIATMP